MKDLTLPPDETYKEQLVDAVTSALEPLKLFFETLEGGVDQDQRISVIGHILHDKAVMQIEEVLDLVDKQVGKISFTSAYYHNSKEIPVGKLLSVQLEQ